MYVIISAKGDIMGKIILGVGALVLLTALRMGFVSGLFNNNTIMLKGISIGLLLYGWFFDRLKKLVWLTVTIIATVSAFMGFSVFLAVYGGRSTVTYDEDIVLVLGGGVRHGEVQSALRTRLDRAIEYHHRNPTAMIIVTGGTGHREPFSEAEAMARYLIDHGVPADRILLEDAAYSTYSNMAFSRILFDAYILPLGTADATPTVAVITNDFHMFRSIRFAEGVGFCARAYPSHTPWYVMPFMYVREVAAVVKMWIIGT